MVCWRTLWLRDRREDVRKPTTKELLVYRFMLRAFAFQESSIS